MCEDFALGRYGHADEESKLGVLAGLMIALAVQAAGAVVSSRQYVSKNDPG